MSRSLSYSVSRMVAAMSLRPAWWDEPAGEVTEGGEVAGPVPGADLGVVFTQGSVADPVNLVFYAPV